MTRSRLRGLSAAVLLLLCGGCAGNCLNDVFGSFFDGLGSALGGDSYAPSYEYVLEADGGAPRGAGSSGDAGIE